MSLAAWSDYWAGGSQQSFQADDRWKAELERLWVQRLSEVVNDGDVVLDMCCGSGALGDLLLTLEKEVLLDGIDYAAPRQGVDSFAGWRNVYSNIDLTVESFAGYPRYNLVLSQHGIEYVLRERKFDDFLLLFNDGAKFIFLMHSPESDLVKVAVDRLRQLQELLLVKGVVATLGDYIDGLVEESEVISSAKKYMALPIRKSRDCSGQVMNAIDQLVKMTRRGEDCKTLFNSFVAKMKFDQDRLLAMQESAMSEVEIRKIFSGDQLADVSIEPANIGSQNIGWFVSGTIQNVPLASL